MNKIGPILFGIVIIVAVFWYPGYKNIIPYMSNKVTEITFYWERDVDLQNKNEKAIIGKWNGKGLFKQGYVFKADKTGFSVIQSSIMHFTWRTNGKTLLLERNNRSNPFDIDKYSIQELTDTSMKLGVEGNITVFRKINF